MRYKNICKGIFIERPNRFTARVEIDGQEETVHVKNTGRCRELLVPGAAVYVQNSGNPNRKTQWDLIAVEKGERLVNMDSQIPNKAVLEWMEEGHFADSPLQIQPEYTYGDSRLDFYVTAGKRKIFVEVKGVTLEQDGVSMFPDAPSERAVKHVKELQRAVSEGYEGYVFFVIQMKGVRCFTPNRETHPEFAEALFEASKCGVNILAYDCEVTKDSIRIRKEVPVILENPVFQEMVTPLVKWYRENKRELPWRENVTPYRVWVSEIMLQQTRVEAVKPYYERFLKELPGVRELAGASEDKLLKLWEGLGYYNRVRNMQKAAQQIMVDYDGKFPATYEGVSSLKGIGAYTAGAICSFAYGIAKPAVDGNVLRVITRLTGDDADIMKQSTRKRIEEALEKVIPKDAASDFNQGLIELGAIVCVPNGQPNCGKCPLSHLCCARRENAVEKYPVKAKKKERRIEKKTVLVFWDESRIAIQKRGAKGLLAGLYELPNVQGHLSQEEAVEYAKSIGLMPVQIEALGDAKHIFSHVEWHMKGYFVRVDELEKTNQKNFLFIHPEEIEQEYPIPSAFEKYKSVWRR